jgi:hypothetical protein
MADKDHRPFMSGDEVPTMGDLFNLHANYFPDMERFSL